ncbi:MAG: SET domain-containing protein-lysine N-methyltransferase [Simkaniaceae bacterium]|nr:SET domain-containing protein-lysine N-methyltransferase [Simkaniaceae bacterium]
MGIFKKLTLPDETYARYLHSEIASLEEPIRFQKGAISNGDFEKKFQVTYLSCLQFESRHILEWAAKKCQKRLKKKGHQKNNNWALALFKQNVLSKPANHTYIDWINPYIGYGVFAMHDIKELTYMGEYTGIVRKRNRKKDLCNNYIFRYVTGPRDTPFVVDAKSHGNFTRFMNHSDMPNLTSRWIIADGITHIILFANRFIKKGEQLTYNYGPNYWKSRAAPSTL